MVGAMNSKTLTILASALVGVVALVIAVMAVGAIPLGADGPSISNARYAERTAAADKLQSRIEALAKDVPPALPDVPERLSESSVASAPDTGGGTGGDASAATPIPDVQVAPPTYQDDDGGRWGDDGDREEGEHGGDHEDD